MSQPSNILNTTQPSHDFLEKVQAIAYLGPGGSYTEMAKDVFCQRYGLNAHMEPLNTIKRVIQYVEETPNSVGVLPIENSIEGTVRETVDNLIRTKNDKIRILSEFVMPIKHCLISRTSEFYSISGIISHPQAIAQCQNFIHNELPMHLNVIEVASTAEAARRLQEYNLTYAAIGSEKTAEIYNLNILKENINDEADNRTRFALIGDFESPQTQNDNTTIAFSTENKPGALLDVLQVFQKHGINLSSIDSRPSKLEFGEYKFFVIFDGHFSDEKNAAAIEEIKKHTDYYRLIGSYERF